MSKYFLIPIIIFFIIISLFVIYLQFINENWKFIAPKKILPDICNDNNSLELITHSTDYVKGRSFIDNPDQFIGYQFHSIYLLPCDKNDRKFDTNLNIQSSLISINKWFKNKTKDQKINFDKKSDDFFDVTFLRVNKTVNWFTSDDNEDVGTKIENIILSNSNIFNNFNKKKFIVFFEGWAKRKSFYFDICGQSRLNGKVAIFFTNSKWKKDIGNKKMFSCSKDSLNDLGEDKFGESEGTILHEILHTLGAPPQCAKNLDTDDLFHVIDNKNDILYKISGDMYLDYDNDDYYKHGIKNCPDLAKSKYLVKF